VSPEFAAGERERARELLESVQTETGCDGSLVLTAASSVGRGLHEIAERTEADLLVVGSTSHSLFGHSMISVHTREALNGAPCAVAVAPAGYAERPGALREIGVGYDGSAESEHALAVARELATELGAKVSAFQAIEIPAHLLGGPGPADEQIDRLLAIVRGRITDLGCEPHAAYGHPAEELALYGASVDLLVVGSRGYGPVGRLMHGSTSQRLAQTARCPLLVLTRAAGSANGSAGIEVAGEESVVATTGRR
jgi:nucleotide-binding universal stress UspA family protein